MSVSLIPNGPQILCYRCGAVCNHLSGTCQPSCVDPDQPPAEWTPDRELVRDLNTGAPTLSAGREADEVHGRRVADDHLVRCVTQASADVVRATVAVWLDERAKLRGLCCRPALAGVAS